MITNDPICGQYDYEREEAQREAEFFLETLVPEYPPERLRREADKIKTHWQVVLCDKGMADFTDEWNKRVPAYPI